MKDDEKALLTFCIFICILVGGMIFAGFQAGHIYHYVDEDEN